jgi:hypothetical protein
MKLSFSVVLPGKRKVIRSWVEPACEVTKRLQQPNLLASICWQKLLDETCGLALKFTFGS